MESGQSAAERRVQVRIAPREPAPFGILSFLTLGLYGVYLVYRWAEEINILLGRRKYEPVVILIVGLLTCTIGFSVAAMFYAFDLERLGKAVGYPKRTEHLGTYVVFVILLSCVVGILSGGLAVLLSIVLWVVGLWLIQNEINGLLAAVTRGELAAER